MTEPYLCDKRVCPARGSWISFRFVDEFGDGKPYAGLTYELTDSEGEKTEGNLDSDGYAKVGDNYKGPVTLSLAKSYAGGDKWYEDLADRKFTDFH